MHTISKALRALVLAMAFAMLAGMISGCSVTNPNPTVLKVGNIEVGMADYYEMYDNYSTYYGYFSAYDVSTPEKHREFQDMIFEMLISQVLPVYKAGLEGITLDAEEEAVVQQKLQDEIDGYLEGYAEDIIGNLATEEEIRAEAMKLFKKDLKENSWTYDSYIKRVETGFRNEAIADKYYEIIYSVISVSEEEKQAFYEATLSEQTAAYTEDPAKYYDDYSSHYSSGTVMPLVAPEGYHFYKHIFVPFPAEGDAEAAAATDAKLKEIIAKLAEGADFETLITEYGEDSGMSSEPQATHGYLVGDSIIDNYYEGFAEACLALENIGDYTAEPVESSGGYHFIMYVGDVSTEPTSYEDAAEDINNVIYEQKKDDLYLEKYEGWKADTTIKKYYDRVENIK